MKINATTARTSTAKMARDRLESDDVKGLAQRQMPARRGR
jgi:hypothetical protein